MTRLALALAAWISFLSVLSASFAPRTEAPSAPRQASSALAKRVLQVQADKLSARVLELAGTEALQSGSEFVLTAETEILLNGRPCSYEKIPGHARIVRMEVAADKKTVLKIHFRTGK